MTTIPETTLLAALDGVEYLLLTSPAVLAVRNDLVAYYCGGGEWDASPAAQEATRRHRITALEAELAQLRAAGPLLPAPATDAEPRAACPHCGGTYKARGMTRHLSACPKRPAALAAAPVEEPPPAPVVEVVAPPAPEPLPPEPSVVVEVVAPAPRFRCDACGRDDFPSKAALSGHIGRVHVALARKVAETPPWACATCGKGPGEVERSISDPARCKACVRAANDAAPKASAALAATVTARPKAGALPS